MTTRQGAVVADHRNGTPALWEEAERKRKSPAEAGL
jgi:hypothetical protein